jgi:hypothetical protein
VTQTLDNTVLSIDSRSFRPVPLKNGRCPNDEWHFKGAAREVYSYLKLLGQNHGGFVFCSVGDIVRHTKRWSKKGQPYGESTVKRILAMFRQLGVIGSYETRKIHGRTYHGWQFGRHEFWAQTYGDFCDFKDWDSLQSKYAKWMGNAKSVAHQQNETENETHYENPSETDFGQYETQNETAHAVQIA